MQVFFLLLFLVNVKKKKGECTLITLILRLSVISEDYTFWHINLQQSIRTSNQIKSNTFLSRWEKHKIEGGLERKNQVRENGIKLRKEENKIGKEEGNWQRWKIFDFPKGGRRTDGGSKEERTNCGGVRGELKECLRQISPDWTWVWLRNTKQTPVNIYRKTHQYGSGPLNGKGYFDNSHIFQLCIDY